MQPLGVTGATPLATRTDFFQIRAFLAACKLRRTLEHLESGGLPSQGTPGRLDGLTF